MKTISLDEFGRILIPKNLRKQLNLHSGQELEISVEENELRIKIIVQNSFQLVNGVPVFSSGKQKIDSNVIDWMHTDRIHELLQE